MHALLGRTVSERFRDDVAATALLNGVIAHGRRGAQRFFDITGFEYLARALGVMGPDAGIAIRLQLEPH
jgi:hypothetical protein